MSNQVQMFTLIPIINLTLLIIGSLILIARNTHRLLGIGLLICALLNMTGVLMYVVSDINIAIKPYLQNINVAVIWAARINVYVLFILLVVLAIKSRHPFAKIFLSITILVAVVNIAFPFFMNIFHLLPPSNFVYISTVGAVCYCIGCYYAVQNEVEEK